MTVEQAKACSHNRLTLEGEMDEAREKILREVAAGRAAPSGVVNFALGPDSSDENNSDSESNSSRSTPPPTALRHNDLGRTDADRSLASQELPLVVCPKRIEPECDKAGNLSMVSCNTCDGDLHRSCGVMGGDGDDHGMAYDFQGRRCSACAASKGKKKPAMPY